MSPAELSGVAVELEKRTIRLIWEEGKYLVPYILFSYSIIFGRILGHV